MSYYNNINQTILDLISPFASSVCEFGCGAGALARAAKSRNPDLYYVGVEIAEDQLSLARDVLDVGLTRNLDILGKWSDDAELSKRLPHGFFDHIIFGDVLEHLYDPKRSLIEAVKCLKPAGTALICIPNVQHWSVFANLVSGTWPQDDAGIFDRTHIRWFTLDDMIRLLTSSGLDVVSIHPRIFHDERGLSILEDLEAVARNIGAQPERLLERGQVLQYVLVGRKSTSTQSAQ
ncbi:class I SAM-dependent methyltransferase [Rhodoferax sp. GW822-FHT02A01]|uniref:class I SAM-dependent methyltransferase n=1 Tax=Rhodoferax sp. GW822-FHT02A01 TaxID=3141537 RepID=UPI00315D2910